MTTERPYFKCYCPLTQSNCENGFTDKSEERCGYWDSLDAGCLQIMQMRFNVDFVLAKLGEIYGDEAAPLFAHDCEQEDEKYNGGLSSVN